IDKVTWLTPNETESELLFDNQVDDALKAYPHKLIVTKGASGAMYYSDSQQLVEGYKKQVVDTTGAGDTFNGALAVALIENKPLEQA
ncbi:PfkB family carbohydrate kinase, partial [Staphylococcus aureus]